MVDFHFWQGYNLVRYESRRDLWFRRRLVELWPTWTKPQKEKFKEGVRVALEERKCQST